MWSGGTVSKNGPNGGRNDGTPQLVAVAIDADKNSQHALKWAADHLLSKGQFFFLVHVRRKVTTIPTPTGSELSISEVNEEVANAFLEQMDLQTKELLLPFQCFCSRRGLHCREVILDEMDVSKAIVDFMMHRAVDKLVLGASSRNAFTRAFKQVDVPTAVSRIAPDFCTVYVISKGKISSVRPATLPNKNQTNRADLEFKADGNPFQSVKSEPDTRDYMEPPTRSSLARTSKIRYDGSNGLSERIYDDRVGQRINRFNQPEEHRDYLYKSVASCPSPNRGSIEHPSNYFHQEFLDRRKPSPLPSTNQFPANHDMQDRCSELNQCSFGSCSGSSGSSRCDRSPPMSREEVPTSWSDHSVEDIDAELRRLKLELKQKSNALQEDNHKELQGYFKKFDGELGTEGKGTGPFMDGGVKSFQDLLEADTRPTLETMGKRNLPDSFSSNIRYRRYNIEEIHRATENFSNALKIGEGGYGPVYKSTLDHTLVAIKILRSDVTQGMIQFQQEVEVLSCIRHPNMVLLLGACPEYGCLVYEYMANGSLEDRLLCRSGTPPLSWQLRFKIAAEIATGLLFLHQSKPEPIVHRDLKPGNILLDHNFVSKIADVGLARLVPQSVSDATTQYRMTAAAGTFCYIDPEYQKTGTVGTKSDVYALGIIVLQLITGQPPMGLAHNVGNALEMGKLRDILDPKVPDWPMDEMIKFAELGLKCAELRRKDRPDLRSVVLPELNRLCALATSTVDATFDHHCQRSRSYKEPMRPTVMSDRFLDDGIVKGSSFMF